MICPNCHGLRYAPIATVSEDGGVVLAGRRPCPVCGGCGLAHCCDGDRMQPEPERVPPSSREARRPAGRATQDQDQDAAFVQAVARSGQ